MERIFVALAKTAFNELALKEPNELIRTIDDMVYSGTIVQHEIVMYALLSLPVDFSDFAVNWLLEDFGRRVFVYSDSPRDYLDCSKKILKKFSPIAARICSAQSRIKYITGKIRPSAWRKYIKCVSIAIGFLMTLLHMLHSGATSKEKCCRLWMSGASPGKVKNYFKCLGIM